MTENNATDELRALLDERGVEWKDGDAAYEIEWSTPDGRHCSAMYWKPKFTVLISGCAPEQAIAATLGSGTLTAEQVRKAIEKRFDFDVWVPPVRWQAIADELNARAERTCKVNIGKTVTGKGQTYVATCDSCGRLIGQCCDYGPPAIPNYCPNCGARVIKAVEE